MSPRPGRMLRICLTISTIDRRLGWTGGSVNLSSGTATTMNSESDDWLQVRWGRYGDLRAAGCSRWPEGRQYQLLIRGHVQHPVHSNPFAWLLLIFLLLPLDRTWAQAADAQLVEAPPALAATVSPERHQAFWLVHSRHAGCAAGRAHAI